MFCTCPLILLFQEHGFWKWNEVVYELALKVLSFYEVWPLWVLILCFGFIFCRGNEWTPLGFLSLIKKKKNLPVLFIATLVVIAVEILCNREIKRNTGSWKSYLLLHIYYSVVSFFRMYSSWYFQLM